MVYLKEVTKENIDEVLELSVREDQKSFVSTTAESLAQAYVYKETSFPFAVYNDKKVVGFLMVCYNEGAFYEIYGEMPPSALVNNYSICRIMIDKRYQGRGYGRATMQAALDFIKTWPCGVAEYCEISYEPENKVAKNLYASLGFVENGELDGNETVAVLKL